MGTIDSKFVEKPGEAKRDETLSLNDIDEEYLKRLIEDQATDFNNAHGDFFRQREDWLLSLRDMTYQYKESLFEHSSNLHVPFTLIMAKALHAKLFQTFSQQNIVSVRAQNEAFQGKEDTVKWFMTWVLEKWINRGLGYKDVLDAWITQIVDEGSGIKKLGWDQWEANFLDLDIVTEETPMIETFADEENLDVEAATETTARIKNVKKSMKMSAPWVSTVEIDDFRMPAGHRNVQSAPYIMHRVYLNDDEMKLRARRKRFDEDVVQEALEMRKATGKGESRAGETHEDTRRKIREQEGVSDDTSRTLNRFDQGLHTIWEWHGKAYITKEMDDDVAEDIKKSPQDIVIWYHADLRKILGWTYLYRISPSGRRPFYKADFMPAKERAFGVGTGELLWALNNHIDAVHNLKLDNGVLASLQFGLYRAGSTLKPDTFKLRPGDLVPVEDPNDVKFANFPYLGQFGENEELVLTGYGEKLLAINDINLGNLTGRGVAGALRNATGANFVDRQANIQLHPHLDRIAREMQRFMNDLFILCRSRMDGEIYFRVTGEDGKGVFGNVDATTLRGDFDFDIDTDLAAASEAENQQRASLLVQNLSNPMFQQLGIVQPGNLYEAVKELLIKNGVRHPDKFITKPPQYSGPPMTKETRLLYVLTGQDDPPVEQTVRPEDNHELALAYYEKFQKTPAFGFLDRPKLAAFMALMDEHTKYLSILQSGAQGMPNRTGTQLPMPGSAPPGPAPGLAAQEGGPMGAPVGEPNGPIF